MKENFDIRFNPKTLSDSDVAKHKNFDALLKRYEAEKPAQRPIIRRIAFFAGAIAAAITVLFLVYNGVGGNDYQQKQAIHFNEKPYINPPLVNAKPQFASYQVNAHEGGVYKYPSGSQLVVPAAAFVGPGGQILEGEVTIHYREMHDFVDFFLSGIPMTYDSAGVQYTLESAGMVEIFAEQGGQRVLMAPGKSIDVELVSRVNVSPQMEVPKGFNIYKLDTENRKWVYTEIDRIEVLDDDLAFGQIKENDPLFKEKTALQQQIQAIQLNKATALAKIEASFPKPAQPIKPEKAMSDDHVFNLDLSDLNKPTVDEVTVDADILALYRKYEKMLWQVSPNATVSANQLQAFGNATNMSIEKASGRDFELTLEKPGKTLKVLVNPVLSGAEYDAAIAEHNRDLAQFQQVMARREQQLKSQKEALEKEIAEEKRLAKLSFDQRIEQLLASGQEYAATDEIIKQKVVNRFQATGFGIWNCDRPLPPDLMVLTARFKDKSGKKFENRTAYLVDKNRNTVVRFLAVDGAAFRFNANSDNLLWLVTEDNKIAVFRPEDFKAIEKGTKEHTFVLSTFDKKIEDEEDVREVLYL